MDIATLGLALDSRPIVAGVKALDDLAAAAKPAAAGVDKLSQAVKQYGQESGRSFNKPASDAAAGLDKITKSGGLARHELINLSRQLQDVGVSLAGGQSLFTVFAQQGAQIADIYGSSKTGTVGGSLKQIAGGIASVLTPARLLVGGLGALAIGGGLAIKSLADSGKQFDDVSRSIGVTTDRLHALQQAAAFKGIGQNDFFKGMQQFGAQVYEAQHAMGGLAEVMAANGKSAKDTNGYLEAAADLIKNARSDQQRLVLLQQMGLPATMDWVRLLSQGKDGIRAATEEAVKFNASAEGKLVASARKFDDEWNKATTKATNYIKAFALNSADSLANMTVPPWLAVLALGGAGALGGALAGPVGMIAGGAAGIGVGLYGTGANLSGQGQAPTRVMINGGTTAPKPNGGTIDKDALQRQIQLEQQRLGVLGQVVTIDEQIRGSELSIKAARLQPGSLITDADVKRVSDYAKQTALGTLAIRQQADAFRVDAATVGMSVGAAAEYAAVQQRINTELAKGNTLRPDQLAAIQKEAGALGQAAQNADNLRFAYGALVQGPIQTFTGAIANGSKAWDAFKQAGVSALSSIASRLADMASQNLWGAAFGGSGGGLLSGLFGGSGVSAQAASASTLANNTGGAFFGPGFASGGFTGFGGKYEPAGVVHKGEYVMDAVSTRRIGVRNLDRMRGYADGGLVDGGARFSPRADGGDGMTVRTGDTSIVIQGNADERTIAMLRQELAARDAALPGQVVAAVKKARAGRSL
ncbi:phage tail length tape measure family protein [Bradyrhizobium sp. USDA 10063]